MAKTKKGKDKAEYPKLVRTANGKKVRVLSAEDEAKLELPKLTIKEDKQKAPGWGS